MGKTYRHLPKTEHRNPRGRLRALRNGARKGAIPPDPWEDAKHNKECWIPFSAAKKMKKGNVPKSIIRRKLMRRFHLESWQVTDIFDSIDTFDFMIGR